MKKNETLCRHSHCETEKRRHLHFDRCHAMRHTPPLRGTPLREGMARQRHTDNTQVINAEAHPISERGEGTASGRSDSEAVNKNKGRDVSHCVALPSTQKTHTSASKCFRRICTISTSFVVRLMSACCPLVVRFKSGQQADIKRTSSGQQADNKRRRYL